MEVSLIFSSNEPERLHDYFLAHRDDQEAFYAYIDKLHAEGVD